MKIWTALLLVVASVHSNSQNYYGWTPGKEYIFHYQSKVLNGIPEISQSHWSDIKMNAKVHIQSYSDYTLHLKITDPEFSRIKNENITVSEETGTILTEQKSSKEVKVDSLPEEFKCHLMEPVLVHMKSGLVESFQVAKMEPTSVTNIKKAILSQIQMDVAGTRRTQIQTNHIQFPISEEGNRSEQVSFFTTMEESVQGECLTDYTIHKLSKNKIDKLEEAWRKEELKVQDSNAESEAKTVCNGKPYYLITKTKNMEQCKRTPIFQMMTRDSIANFDISMPNWLKAMMSNTYVCGELNKFIVRNVFNKKTAENSITDEKIVSLSPVTMSLLKVKTISTRFNVPNSTRAVTSLIFEFPTEVDAINMTGKPMQSSCRVDPPSIQQGPVDDNEVICSVCGIKDYDYCRPTWTPQPNLVSSFLGIDIAKKSPLPDDDDFRRGQIFKPVYPNQRFNNMDQYNFYTNMDNLICSSEFEERAYYSMEDYIEGSSHEFMESWEIGWEAPKLELGFEAGPLGVTMTAPPNSMSSGNSNDESMSKYRQFFEKERGSISRSTIKCSVYVVDVDINSPSLTLNENFENAIRNIDSAVGHEKDNKMKDFIELYGTHYASQSVMGIATILETRFTQKETLDYSEKVRNGCNSKSKGFNLFAAESYKSSSECTGSLNDTTLGANTSVNRYRRLNLGTLPADTKSLEGWSSLVLDMMVNDDLNPLPTSQVLHPIMDILMQPAVVNLKRSNGSRIDHQKLLATAIKGYVDYLPSSFGEKEYQFSCANTVRIGSSTYTKLKADSFYKDDNSHNYLYYDEQSGWTVSPNSEDSGQHILISDPCPRQSAIFQNPTYLEPPLPGFNDWKACASNCFANKPKCRFWQHDGNTKLCSLLTDYGSMVETPNSNQAVGSVDCPGIKYKYAFGLCPENTPSRSMIRKAKGPEADKYLSIEVFDPTLVVEDVVLIVGGYNGSPISSSEVVSQGNEHYIPDLPFGGGHMATLVLTPGDNKVLHCGGIELPYRDICLELDVDNSIWKQHSKLPGVSQGAQSVTMPNGVYLFSDSDKIYFLPRMDSTWDIGPTKPVSIQSKDFCVVRTSDHEFHILGQKSLKYDTLTNSWTTLNNLGLIPRSYFACAMFDDAVIVTGGLDAGREDVPYLSTTELIHIKDGNVTYARKVGNGLNERRARHDMAVFGGRYKSLTAFGGGYLNYLNTIEVWDPVNLAWKIAPFTIKTARTEFGILAVPETLISSR